jgi:hypothetical protein
VKKQVDQSGRFEDARATVWAYADGESRSLVMSAAVKRKVFAFLKRRGITGVRALVRAYTAVLFVLLKDIIAVRGVVIELDREYPGYDAEIKAMLLRKLRQAGINAPGDAIIFGNIGKLAEAHRVAWQIYVGRKEPDRKATWPEVKNLL